VVLYEKVKENASIDWTIKESVKAKLKESVKLFNGNKDTHQISKCWQQKPFQKSSKIIAEELTMRVKQKTAYSRPCFVGRGWRK
jgi:type I restriction enzyme R subunit